MVTVCLTCGDKGIRNALIYCDNCQIYAVHRYCLFVLPKNLNGPVVWFCEDCELAKDVKSSSVEQCGSQSLGCFHERNGSVVRCSEKKEDSGYLLRKVDGPSLKNCSLRQSSYACCSDNVMDDRPYVKEMNLDDDFSADSNQKDRRKNGVNCGDFDKETEFRKTAECQSTVLYASSAGNQICQVSQDDNFSTDSDQKDWRKNGVHIGDCDKELEFRKTEECQAIVLYASGARNQICNVSQVDDFSADSNQKDQRKNGVHSGDCDKESEFRRTAECQSVVLHASSAGNQICHVSQPVQKPIWRGSVNISNKNFATFDWLVAHLSTLACTRVHEQARMLPGLLSPDMLPRSAVWPKAFEKSRPTYDSIGFYIFSDSKRSEKAYGNLMLEMIHQDLALKGVVQNAEFLIFTSTLLPMDYWRFQGKLYLWGVFKGKENCLCCIRSCS